MLNNPVGQLLLGGQFWRRHGFPCGLEHVRLDGVGLFVVERETEETELDDGTKLAGQAAE
jgi:hypothetical protein